MMIVIVRSIINDIIMQVRQLKGTPFDKQR